MKTVGAIPFDAPPHQNRGIALRFHEPERRAPARLDSNPHLQQADPVIGAPRGSGIQVANLTSENPVHEPRRSGVSAERRRSTASQYAALYRAAATVHGPDARPLLEVEAPREPERRAPARLDSNPHQQQAELVLRTPVHAEGERHANSIN